MQKSTNYKLNLPDFADQFNLNHWNENTEKLDLELKKETDSRINNDNQLQSNINNSVSTLRNEISTAETNAKNLANATGVLPIAKGGTGATDAKNGFTNLASGLEQRQNPLDTEYMIFKSGVQWALYTFLQFWEYIKGKISSVLGLTESQYNGNAKTATNANNAYRGMVHTCSIDAREVAKTVSIPGFTLTQGACIRVLFTNGNSVASPTLNVNNTGAKEIRVKQGSEYVPLSAETGALGQGAYGWQSNTILELFYTGTYWIVNENAIVNETLNSELGYLSSRVFINGRKELWGGTSPYDITANESKTMTMSSDLPINGGISNHSLSVITEIESTYVNAYGTIKLIDDIMDNPLKFSIYSRNPTNNSYRVKTVHIFVTGY